MEGILYNWEAFMSWGSCKSKTVARWLPRSIGVFKFNVDDAAKSKPGLAGLLRNNDGGLFWICSLRILVLRITVRRKSWPF